MAENKRIGLNPLDAMMQTSPQVKPTIQDSYVPESKETNPNLPYKTEKSYQRYTFFLTVKMKKWLDKTIYQIKMDHEFGGANTSNLISFLVAKAQKDGINYNEYQAYVKANRGKK